MDFSFTDEQEKFRQEVRDFLDEQIKKGVFEPRPNAWILEESEEFTHLLAERGWFGMTWPKEYGGQGRPYLDRLVLFEELVRYGAPIARSLSGDRQMGPAIIAYGSEEQKKFFLPKIIRGEINFAIGLSEPEAGSDLGGITTRAVEDGDSFVINGQKVWTSGASGADYIYMIARTNSDPNVSRYRSVSELIVDLKTPGITIRPLIDITGGDHWNEVFFDDVRVPKTVLIGQKDRGFYQIMSHLENERSGIERLMSNYPLLIGIIDYVKNTKRNGVPLSKDPWIRRTLADLLIKLEAGKPLIYRVAWAIDQGEKEKDNLGKYTSMAKAFGNKFEQELDNAAIDIVGLYGQLDTGSKRAILNGITVRSYLYSPAHTLQAGTYEILLNILATRGLGLPRE